MLKIHHTAYPKGREPKVCNEVKEGGLWYRDEQEQLLNQARRLLRREQLIREAKQSPVDQIKIFAKWFWIAIALGTVITFYILNNHK